MTTTQTKQEIVTEKRAEYMAGKMTHQAYYEWLSDFIGIGYSLIPFTAEKVAASTDQHLNDLPLANWDRMDYAVRRHATGLSWSLSDTVCCLKALARKRQRQSADAIITDPYIAMRPIRVTFANGNTIDTNINGTRASIEKYYVGNWFNLGTVDDDMQQAVSVEFK